tara:strand:- start:7645 stop:8265 length:621 start_codon:yes stop_codon:yes gene_type:complete
MKQEGMIIASEKKRLFKYNTRDQKQEWRISFENKILGISRIENFIFVLSQSWGSLFTSMIDYQTGNIKWKKDKMLYNIHIFNDSIIFIDTNREVVSISLDNGNENFRVKTGFKWSSPKMALINQKIYLFSKKKTVLLDLKTGALVESKLPSKLDTEEITFLIDEFQMNINTLNYSDTGFFPIYDAGDIGGFDAGVAGGDVGGAGDE